LSGLSITGGSISATDSILSAFGKVQGQLNALVGGVMFKGVWNASTNNPTLTSSVGTQGWYYIVNVAGNTDLNGITDWQVGDWAIFNGSTWNKIDNTDLVTSVNGQTGAVSLTTDNISEGITNLYYTDTRARNSVSATTPLAYNNISGVFSIQSANSSQNGYLSSTDWSTFNSKQDALSGTGLVKSTTGVISYIADNSSNWDIAYDNSIISAAVTGTSVKTLTLNQQDGGTITATWSDANTGLTSVGLSMPSAFSVSNSPLVSNGTIGVTGAGTASQYIRGDGQLATLPTGGGGGSSVSYYLNGGTSQGTIGGNPYEEMSRTAVVGTNVDFNINTDGYVANFVTDAGDPALLQIPGGNWNFELFFSASSSGGTPSYYVELYKYDGVVLTLIADNSATPEAITGGTSIDLYVTALAVPQTSLTITDRLAVRVYVIHSGRTITLHTQGTHLCQVITTFSTGISALNGLTAQVQYFATGTAGTDFAINSATATHTFNLPTASATNRGALSTTDWTTFNNKADALSGTNNTVAKFNSSTTIGDSNIKDNGNAVSISTTAGSFGALQVGNYNGSILMNTANTSGGLIFQNSSSSNKLWDFSSYNNDINFNESGVPTPVMTLQSGGNIGINTIAPSNRLDVVGTLGATGIVTLDNLAGSGNRMVIANSLGVLSTQTITTGTVTAVTASSPLASSGGNTPNITIQQSSGSQDGYLSSTDWTTFNNKQASGNYITSLTGEATGTGPGATTVTLNNASVTGKVLTGINITGGTVVDTDSILTGFGKLQNQVNGLIGGTIYQGTWNANTNTPALTSGVGTKGYYYIVSVAGTTNLDGITDWFVGDWAIFDGTAWQQVDNTDAVVSVNGQTGAVSLTTDNIPEGTTNLYYLDSRARAALSFTAGSGAYNSTTGVITIPTNTSQLTNGANFITLASLSGTSPIVYNNTTGNISINQSSTSSSGYLSSTDWNTFNGKQNTITLTTTGTSGAATFIANVLNIPNYSTDLSGYLPLTGGALTGSLSITSAAPTALSVVGIASVSGNLILTGTYTDYRQQSYIRFSNTGGGTRWGYIQHDGTNLTFFNDIAGGGFTFNKNVTFSSTLSNGTYTYTLPSATGTLALTSSLSGYLPLTGGTLTNTLTTTGATNPLIIKGTNASTEWTEYYYNTSTLAGYIGNGSGILSGAANSDFIVRSESDFVVATGGNSRRLTIASTGAATFSSSVTAQTNLGFINTNSSQAGFVADYTGTGALKVSFSTYNDVMNIYNETNGYSIMNFTRSSKNLVINPSGGNVGIGTTSPVSLLTVATGNVTNAGQWSSSAIALYNPTNVGAYSQISFGYTSSTTNASAYIGYVSTNQASNGFGDLVFGTRAVSTDTQPTERMRITSGGNVGIGTTSPTGKLDVLSTYASDVTAQTVLRDNTGVALNFGGTASGFKFIQAQDAGGASTFYNLLLNPRGGNVLIGTTTDNSFRLQVLASGAPMMSLATSSATGGYLEVRYNTSSVNGYLGAGNQLVTGGAVADMALTSNTGSVLFATGGGTERMRITSGGEVQINGTTSASGASKLTVRYDGTSNYPITVGNENVSGGLIRFAGNGSGVLGSITHNGTNVAYNTSSDYRLKEDFKEFNGLELISKIKTYDYAWKSNKSRMYGFIAHELQDILPYTVNGKKDEVDEDGNAIYQGVDYSKIVPILIKAIQEQMGIINELKEKMITLESK